MLRIACADVKENTAYLNIKANGCGRTKRVNWVNLELTWLKFAEKLTWLRDV